MHNTNSEGTTPRECSTKHEVRERNTQSAHSTVSSFANSSAQHRGMRLKNTYSDGYANVKSKTTFPVKVSFQVCLEAVCSALHMVHMGFTRLCDDRDIQMIPSQASQRSEYRVENTPKCECASATYPPAQTARPGVPASKGSIEFSNRVHNSHFFGNFSADTRSKVFYGGGRIFFGL